LKASPPFTITASMTTPLPVIATSSSWPCPVFVGPALVCTVPETLASLAPVPEVDPTCVSDAKPTSAHVVALPATSVARESDGDWAWAWVSGPAVASANDTSAMNEVARPTDQALRVFRDGMTILPPILRHPGRSTPS
jgi:hypothetical protein